ncbi:hypothetical protein V6N13_114430 [Hibiscus sabdariffa]
MVNVDDDDDDGVWDNGVESSTGSIGFDDDWLGSKVKVECQVSRTNLTSANRLSKTINEENATLLRGQIGSGRHDTSKNAVRAGTAKPFKCLRFPRSEMETNISSYQQTMVAS